MLSQSQVSYTTSASDNVNNAGRALPVGIAANNQMTDEACTTACFNAGYPLAGTEYAT